MTKTFDQGKEEIIKLCQYFETNKQSFHTAGVKEAHIRQSLIDPFFEALGWDVRNTAMIAPQYREIVTEDSLDVEGHQKAPDYSFRVGPLPKFYTEAKKCSVNINADPAPAYQLRSYGWSAKVAVSILTNFEEFGVYDCTIRPNQSDKASRARILYFRCDEYPEKWRELWDVFSREAVWSGAFDQYAASKRKRGTSEVDVEFLKEIESWRETLARNIALRNSALSSDDLNAAVQRTIDRVVFLRMAEDRGMEPYEQLLNLCERPGIYTRFIRDLCRKADEKYNSGLFHFQKESGVSEAPDRITPKLKIDDKAFKPILQSLYFAHGSPYHFGILPVEILGTVYERFLGKVIRLTAGHQAKIEEKPEVRKAGGVFYTPAYIVDYIVKRTIARQIDGKSPTRLSGGKNNQPLRVLDMACGSGSFLLGAYQCLLDHCLKWYIEHKPEDHKKVVFKDPRTGQWRLSIDEKKRILTTHLFGVDIDPQAVEVSKLSLLLKTLEGENDTTLSMQLKLFHDRALPNLAENIKCGNSLIDHDYFAGMLISDPEELRRVNPLEWKTAFPNAMKEGGFNVIIGNPPYIFARELINEHEKAYYNQVFSQTQFKINTYLLFVEKGFHLLKNDGWLGFIIPNNWLTLETASRFRHFILSQTSSIEIVNSLDKVFDNASVDTSILIFSKTGEKKVSIYELENRQITPIVKNKVDAYLNSHNNVISYKVHKSDQNIFPYKKISHQSSLLGSIAEVRNGIQAYTVGEGTPPQTEQMKHKRVYHSYEKKNDTWLKYVDGVDVYRYRIGWSKQFVKYGPNLTRPRKREYFQGERLLIRQIPAKPPYSILACYVNEDLVNDNNSMIVTQPKSRYDLKYLMGILNSRLISFWFIHSFGKLQRKVFPQFKVKELRTFPIRSIDFSDLTDKTRHDKMVQLVASMLSLQKKLISVQSEMQKEVMQRQIDATDAEIDRLVYQLYSLTEEEIAIIEGDL